MNTEIVNEITLEITINEYNDYMKLFGKEDAIIEAFNRKLMQK